MITWVKCPKCRGEVGIPDNSDSEVLCPRCREPLLLVDPETNTRWMPGKGAPPWMRPWGYVLTTLGGFAFVASAVNECLASHDPPLVAIIFSGLLNPLFFVGVPLGVYWLRR